MKKLEIIRELDKILIKGLEIENCSKEELLDLIIDIKQDVENIIISMG